MTVSGCVAQRADGLVLDDVTHSYLLVGKSDEIAKHVGHRIEITGNAADEEHGKIKTETKEKVDAARSTRRRRRAKATCRCRSSASIT